MLALAGIALAAASTPPEPTGLQQNVAFDLAPPFARNGELLRRLLSPLQALAMQHALSANPRALEALPLAPPQQHFAFYVPASPAPATGYALLVFVPPWKDARIPVQWTPVLDHDHTIFVTAAGSGNDASVLGRRDPLALLAAYNVMQRYHVDPTRVYVGGFSGGSRVALRLALGYPDLFRGALLDAGSDAIGTTQIPLPPPDLMHRFQQASRIVFLTGGSDMIRQTQLARAGASLKQWCVFGSDSITLLHEGHALADAAAFARGLKALSKTDVPDAAKIAACRARNAAAIDGDFIKAKSFANAGQHDQAMQALTAIDARYGGLAAPRSIRLLRAIDSRNAPHP